MKRYNYLHYKQTLSAERRNAYKNLLFEFVQYCKPFCMILSQDSETDETKKPAQYEEEKMTGTLSKMLYIKSVLKLKLGQKFPFSKYVPFFHFITNE